jgi:hypothetical protein
MSENTQTPVERLVQAAVEFARADQALGRLPNDSSDAEFSERSDKLLEAEIRLCDAARAVGDE